MFWRGKKDVFRNPFYNEKDSLVVYIKCDKCGNVMKKRILKSRDFVVSYDGNAAFVIDKLYVCDKCYNQIKVDAGFKRSYKPVYFEINGGSFVTEEEYERKEDEK